MLPLSIEDRHLHRSAPLSGEDSIACGLENGPATVFDDTLRQDVRIASTISILTLIPTAGTATLARLEAKMRADRRESRSKSGATASPYFWMRDRHLGIQMYWSCAPETQRGTFDSGADPGARRKMS